VVQDDDDKALPAVIHGDAAPERKKNVLAVVAAFPGQEYTLAVSGEGEAITFLGMLDSILQEAKAPMEDGCKRLSKGPR
jgi:hypothetical protein